ncbi:MAG: hypothetical protein Q8W45_10520 [Candidatus Palauibacterales bacterium]|jgi:hypothetical protein|nr:hypothetical protein [Candidatus Palauibacterales bacterium]MDP2483709.1 hypothetical protein [Candidatus Palauibacterales bacterium]
MSGLIDLKWVKGYPNAMHGNRGGEAGNGAHRPRLFGLLERRNIALLAVGAVVVLFGYVLLDRGSVVWAPLLLCAGYVVLIPAGLLLGFRGARNDRVSEGE